MDEQKENSMLHDPSSHAYIKKSHTLEDVTSTAYTFTFMGALGLIAILCIALGVLPLPLAGSSKIMFCLVMGAVFLFFTCVGIHSFLRLNMLKQEVQQEEDLTQQIHHWFITAFTSNDIDEQLGIDPAIESAEQLYFPRSSYMKQQINEQFKDLDQDYVESIVDELFDEIFHERER